MIDLIGQLNIAEHHLQTNHRIDRASAEYVIYSKLFNRTNATELMPTVTCALDQNRQTELAKDWPELD